MKRFVVMHDYGSEGWRIYDQCDTIGEAVAAREADLANCGGTSLIFEFINPLAAYAGAQREGG